MTDEDPSAAELKALGLLDFLTADDRPTAVYELDRSDQTVIKLHSKNPIYSNPAFDEIRQLISRHQVHNDPEYSNFLQWVSSTQTWTSSYAGRTWTAFTVHNRWRFASCNIQSLGTEVVSTSQVEGADSAKDTSIRASETEDERNGSKSVPKRRSLDWTQHKLTGLPPYVKFISDFNWAATGLGAKETWHPALRQAAVIIMSDPKARLITWGDENNVIYNAAAISLIGYWHPRGLGRPAAETFGETWKNFKPIIDKAYLHGEVTHASQFPLTLDRGEALEETFWNFTILPIIDKDGQPVGTVNHFDECTTDVVAERRMATILRMGENTTEATNLSEVFKQIESTLDENIADIPFSLIYTVEESKLLVPFTRILANVLPPEWEIFRTKTCELSNTVGIERGDEAITENFRMSDDHPFVQQFRNAWIRREAVMLDVAEGTLPAKFSRVYKGRAGDGQVVKGVLIPVPPISGRDIIGFLFLGLSPRRPCDEEYHLFIRLLKDRILNSVASLMLPSAMKKAHAAAEEAALRHSSMTRQLVIRSREAAESQARFARMAQLAPVGMYLYKAGKFFIILPSQPKMPKVIKYPVKSNSSNPQNS